MRRIQIVLIGAACLVFITSTLMAQKARETMTNAEVVEMVKAGVPESTIVLKIQQSEPNFDISVKALIELTKQGVGQKVQDAMLQPQATKPEPPKRTEPGNAIAWKDIGPLRVVLKSVLPIKLDSGRMGMSCTFEFINVETQKPIVVALNSIASDRGYDKIGSYLRSTLVDENGDVWWLRNSDVTGGIAKIGVGTRGWDDLYDPAEIVPLLSKRDELNSDIIDRGNGYRFNFIFGGSTEMSPGQGVTVIMTFAQNSNQTSSGTPSKVFRMATEIVVGSLTSGSKKSYTLHNLIFDRVSPK